MLSLFHMPTHYFLIIIIWIIYVLALFMPYEITSDAADVVKICFYENCPP